MFEKMITDLIIKMTEFNAGDSLRVQHMIKVYEFAHIIGVNEGLDAKTLKILDIASVMHDIGIRPSEEKYGHCTGKLQEQEGPAYAREMLSHFTDVTEEEKERVCWLIAHHHTYDNIDGLDYRILLEADFLVNMCEDELSEEALQTSYRNIFRTETGKKICREMYDIA